MKKKEDNKLLKIWKAKGLEDAGFKCELCGKSDGQLHPHHFIGRRNRATRWYLPNCVVLCPSHHTMGLWSAHENPAWFINEIRKVRGELWYKDIMKQSNKIFKGTYEQVLKHLEGKKTL